MRLASISAAALFALLLVGSGAVAAGTPFGPGPTINSGGGSHGPGGPSYGKSMSISLLMTGGVVYPGVQNYYISGGALYSGYLFGNPVSSRSSTLRYSLAATVSGLNATGTAYFDLRTRTVHGAPQEVRGSVTILGMTPAVLFPLGCIAGSNCTGAIPAFFEGVGIVSVYAGATVQTMILNMSFESAYLNPFGGPIFFASSNGAVVLVANYTRASIQWMGVQMGGSVTGTAGTSPVSGSFGMLVNSYENLVAGTERDSGSISFFGMSITSVNAAGLFTGYSTIPAASAIPCVGFPAGTCYMTGLESTGVFVMSAGHNGIITGSYDTEWATPAIGFESTVTATLN